MSTRKGKTPKRKEPARGRRPPVSDSDSSAELQVEIEVEQLARRSRSTSSSEREEAAAPAPAKGRGKKSKSQTEIPRASMMKHIRASVQRVFGEETKPLIQGAVVETLFEPLIDHVRRLADNVDKTMKFSKKSTINEEILSIYGANRFFRPDQIIGRDYRAVENQSNTFVFVDVVKYGELPFGLLFPGQIVAISYEGPVRFFKQFLNHDYRFTQGAKAVLRNYICRFIDETSRKAAEITRAAKRKTVTVDDFKSTLYGE